MVETVRMTEALVRAGDKVTKVGLRVDVRPGGTVLDRLTVPVNALMPDTVRMVVFEEPD